MDVAAPPKDFAGRQHSSAISDGDFDCNICLDFAMDPVVTLCGHLYCSACIGKWLLFEDEKNVSPQSCPVCKTSLSQDSLVRLYRRGSIPKRMRQSRDHRPRPPARRHRYDGGYGGEFPSSSTNSRPQLASSAAGGVLGEMEVALYYSSRYHHVGGTGGGLMVRQPERGAERLLRIWLFLLCSIALCLLLF